MSNPPPETTGLSPDARAHCSQFTPSQVRQAYGVCRGIAREAARNFYYAFLALPIHKRNALCAVYAFMRHADDIADEPGAGNEAKLARLDAWLTGLQSVVAGGVTDEPVLLALCDAQSRFQIPVELFEKLVRGTAFDLDERPIVRYQTFAELYDYCYHVASVVGLVCIHVFGYSDPRAEELAERCGIAFQLTNIIRDVKEDALLQRVYLPEEDLQKFGIVALDEQLAVTGDELRAPLRRVLEFEAGRAREFYAAGRELVGLVDEDSGPALWVLVEIYSRLLQKIAARDYDVFGKKISLTAAEKISVLGQGLMKRALA